jgi:hypothetical protein
LKKKETLMKRRLLIVMALLVCVPAAQAARKKAKAGEVEGQVYTDKQFSFSFNLDPDWKYKIDKDEDHHRIIMSQANFQVPPHYLDAPDYTKVPRIVVWADTTTFGPFAFLDSLSSTSYNSEQKKDILSEFEILVDDQEREELVPRRRDTKEFAGEKGFYWTGRAPYVKEVSLSASDAGGKRVRGAYMGTIVGVKKGNVLVMFHMMCEEQYYADIDAELMAMVATLAWTPPDAGK